MFLIVAVTQGLLLLCAWKTHSIESRSFNAHQTNNLKHEDKNAPFKIIKNFKFPPRLHLLATPDPFSSSNFNEISARVELADVDSKIKQPHSKRQMHVHSVPTIQASQQPSVAAQILVCLSPNTCRYDAVISNELSVSIPDNVTSIGDCAFSYCSSLTSVSIPDSVKSIGYGAFSDCSSLTSVSIPDSVTSIGDYAFSYCSSMTSVSIPDGVPSIGYGAFHDCSSMTSVSIPDSVTSIGDGAFSYCSSMTSVSIPDGVTSIGDYAFSYCSSMTSVSIPDSVTSIGDYAFSDCSSMTSVSIPDGVPSIGDGAFDYCSSLTSVSIPDSVTSIGDAAFRGCSSLTSVSFPDNLTSIGYGAFSKCSLLTSVSIPDSVTSIGDGAFSYCSSMTSVSIPDGVPSIGYGAFSYCSSMTSVSIPDGVTSIGDYAFFTCFSLTSVSIPDSVTSIGDGAFSKCSSLTSVSIPDSVTSIGDYAFSYCSSMTSVSIPDGVTSIGDYAFSKCSSLTSVSIPDSVTSIGDYAFSECSSLTFVSIPDSVTSIGDYAFSKCSSLTSVIIPDSVNRIVDGTFSNCSSLTSVNIPDSVTSIGDYAFSGCSSLTSVSIPDSATSIGDYAFSYCSSLTSVIIPHSVTSIGDYAFSDCSSLTSVSIPDSATSIGDYAFSYCSLLTSVIIPNSVTSIGDSAFSGCSSMISVIIGNGFNALHFGIGEDCFSLLSHMTVACSSLISAALPPTLTVEVAKTFYGCMSLTSFVISGFITLNSIFRDQFLLTSVSIPDSVTSIGYGAFSGCSSLTSVSIPDSVISIGDYAFSDCSSLTSVSIPDSVTSIGDYAFKNCSSLTSVSIPDIVTSIGDYAFSDCSSLTSVIIPDSVTSIGDGAFSGCSYIASVIIGTSVRKISDSCFLRCVSLMTIMMPHNIVEIGKNSFMECKNLAQVMVSESVITIGDSAFSSCTTLTEITIPDSVTTIDRYAFYNTSLSSVTFGSGLLMIGQQAFSRTSFQQITFSNSTVFLDEGSFQYCSELKSITFGTGLRAIARRAFFGCKKLKSIHIPSFVTSIEGEAFSECLMLSELKISHSVKKIGFNAFCPTALNTSVQVYQSSLLEANYGIFCNLKRDPISMVTPAPTSEPTYQPTLSVSNPSSITLLEAGGIAGAVIGFLIILALLRMLSKHPRVIYANCPLHLAVVTGRVVSMQMITANKSTLRKKLLNMSLVELILQYGSRCQITAEVLSQLVIMNFIEDKHVEIEDGSSLRHMDLSELEHATLVVNQFSDWIALIQEHDNRSRETVYLVLQACPQLLSKLLNEVDSKRRKCIDIASIECKEIMHRCGYLDFRYELKAGLPEHISETSIVQFAIDHGPWSIKSLRVKPVPMLANQSIASNQLLPINFDDKDASSSPTVVSNVCLKFMKHRAQFLTETLVRQRMQLDSHYVIPILTTFDGDSSAEVDAEFRKSAAKQGYGNYPFVLVMQQADHNLKRIIDQQHIAGQDWDAIKVYFRQIVDAVDHLHCQSIIHGDIKPMNIMQMENRMILIDLDASAKFGATDEESEYAGRKYSSVYLCPELLAMSRDGEVVVRVPPMRNDKSELVLTAVDDLDKSLVTYDLVKASPTQDMWSLGALLFLLCTGMTLFTATVEDNVGRKSDMLNIFHWSAVTKESCLDLVKNTLARNLISLLLQKDPRKRLDCSHVRAHSFLSGRSSTRLQGDAEKYDVFLSYRVSSDSEHVQLLHDLLVTKELKVWWDKKCLLPGQPWEEGFCDGLVNSSHFVCLLSRGAINSGKAWSNFTVLNQDSRCDNVLLEWRLALELQRRGMVVGLFPVMIGDLVAGQYSSYFPSGCHPSPLPETEVCSVEKKVREHLDHQGFGCVLEDKMSVRAIVDEVMAHQGGSVVDTPNVAWKQVAEDIFKMVQISKQSKQAV